MSLKLSLVVATTRLVPVKMKIKGVTDSNSEYRCSCGSEDSYSICIDDEYEDEKGGEQDEEVKGKTNYESMCSMKETVPHIEAIHSKLENSSGQEAVYECSKVVMHGIKPQMNWKFPSIGSPISKGNQYPFFFFFFNTFLHTPMGLKPMTSPSIPYMGKILISWKR